MILKLLGLTLASTLLASALGAAETSAPAANSLPLLDANLSQWAIWISVPHPSVAVPGYVHAAEPKDDAPLGLNNDLLHVFTVRMVDGEPVLHISGEIYGALTTLKSYANFHLRVQQRWGLAKFEPKLRAPRDSGILYRCYGPHGAVGHNWKRSLECQVQENDIGDVFTLGVNADIPCKIDETAKITKPLYRYSPGEPPIFIQGRCGRGPDYHELPNGEWNTIEVMAIGDRSLHILNGHVVNVLQNARRSSTDPKESAVDGEIQIQSEGAECEYRRIEIESLTSFPPEYANVFGATK